MNYAPDSPEERKKWSHVLISMMVGLGFLGAILCRYKEVRDLIFPEYFAVLLLLASEAVWVFGSTTINGNGGQGNKKRLQNVANLGKVFVPLVVFGIYVVFRCGWADPDEQHRIVFIALMWSIAALVVGLLLGFLFGIPRSQSVKKESNNGEYNDAGSTEKPSNTNLERVSDWLTQIIVGGTVTQLAMFPEYIEKLGIYYSTSLGKGEDETFWRIVGVGSAVYFLIVGFLASYLVTKLYLSRELLDAENQGREKLGEIPNLTTAELEYLEDAPLMYGSEVEEFSELAKQAADKILQVPLDELRHWRDLRVWAKAQLAKPNLIEAARAYERAIEIVPNDPEIRLGYAIALSGSKSAQHLLLNQLEHARRSISRGTSHDLRKNIYKALSYAVLYLKKPESFLKVFEYSREYYSRPDVVHSGGFLFNVACAYGQAAAWLKADKSRKLGRKELAFLPVTRKSLNDVDVSEPLGNEEAFEVARNNTLDVLRLTLERRPALRKKLKEMLDHKPSSAVEDKQEDDDFMVFSDDAAFRAMVD